MRKKIAVVFHFFQNWALHSHNHSAQKVKLLHLQADI